jgi:hypothetical protein
VGLDEQKTVAVARRGVAHQLRVFRLQHLEASSGP